MDLPRGLEEMIDEYVANALDSTKTRKPRTPIQLPLPPARASSRYDDVEIDVSDMAAPGEEPSDGLIPVEVDERTDPAAPNMFSFDEGTAWMAPAFVAPADPIPTLSRIRTARGTPPPPAEIEIDEDEITNVLKSPPAPKC